MEKPEIIWKDKNTQSQIIENLSADLLTVDYSVYISTRKKLITGRQFGNCTAIFGINFKENASGNTCLQNTAAAQLRIK